MEERVVPPVLNKTLSLSPNHDHVLHDEEQGFVDPEALRSGTYVVQIPKDQVYRVPPPENALIAERHRNPEKQKKSFPCFTIVLGIIISVVIVIGLILGITYIALKPNDPTFHIEHVVVTIPSSNHSNPNYAITLKAENPNEKTRISYKKGGHAVLLFEEHKLASGDYPRFNQDYKDSEEFDITLHGTKSALPKKIEESLQSKKKKVQVSLSLSMNVRIILDTAGVMSKVKNINVSCKLTLAKSTRVLSQDCNTKS